MQATTSTAGPTLFTLETLLAWLRRQRETGSIHHDEQQRVWQVFGYADAERVLSDPSAFSSDFSEIMPHQRDFDLFARGNFVRMDPPKHRKRRSRSASCSSGTGKSRSHVMNQRSSTTRGR